MSNKYMDLVWESDLERPEKLVCLAIADHVNDEGQGCFASYDRLAYKTGYEPRQVMRIVDKLQEAQIIVWNGEHPKYGTNIWNIDQHRLPKLPPFAAWRKSRNAKTGVSKNDDNGRQTLATVVNVTPGQNITPNEPDIDTGQNVTPQGDILSKEGVTFCSENAIEMSPEPSYKPSNNHPIQPSPRRSAKPLTPAMDARVNPAAKTKTARERAASEQGTENDPRARERPETALQIKIAQLTNSKYLPISTKTKLRNSVTAVWGDNKLPVTHPSPEDEWAAHPKLFAEYVELCARRIREESTRPPSRAALVESIRNYARYNTGWLDFKRAAQEEKRQAEKRADPSAKHNQWYYDPNKPDWMQ